MSKFEKRIAFIEILFNFSLEKRRNDLIGKPIPSKFIHFILTLLKNIYIWILHNLQ